MGKIFYIMGKSSSGKDTIFQKLLEHEKELGFRTVVPYTTRPIRNGERQGGEYFFVGEERLKQLEAEGKVIEQRAYHTVHGVWKYFTADDGQIELEKGSYLMIGTLVSYAKMAAYFGRQFIVPIYIEVDDGERLLRALQREQRQEEPKYAEMCRRFLADSEDFSEENLKLAKIKKRFQNNRLEDCLEEILEFMKTTMNS